MKNLPAEQYTEHFKRSGLITVDETVTFSHITATKKETAEDGTPILVQRQLNTRNYSKEYSINYLTIFSIIGIILLCVFLSYLFISHKLTIKNLFQNNPSSSLVTGSISDKILKLSVIEESTNTESVFNENGFIFSNSDTMLITKEQIQNLQYINAEYDFEILLHFCINEIYARHGYEFITDGIYYKHFNQYGWYTQLPKQQVPYSAFSDIEKQNIELLVDIQANGL